MDSLVGMKVFCLVAEHRSFVFAANRLGISAAMASKHVMHLERRLTTRLLNRTSRHVSLTETGALYFDQVRKMLEGLDEVEAAVSKATVTPRGILKLSAPVWMANPGFVGVLADYQRLYPEVRFDIDLSGRVVNLVDEGFDLALRASDALGEGLIARPLGPVSFRLVGAPAYLDLRGRATEISDLNGHALLKYALAPSDQTMAFEGPLGAETATFAPVLQSANETLLRLAAIEGMGLTFLPACMIEQDMALGRLEPVLPKYTTVDGRLFGVYPSRRYLSAKVRTFLDFISGDSRLA